MQRGIVIDKQGNIKHSWQWITNPCPFPECLTLKEDEIVVDITEMDNDEFVNLHTNLDKHKIELDEKGKHKKDKNGLPRIVKK